MTAVVKNQKGRSHARHSKPCQDRYLLKHCPGGAWVLAVADGHGGSPYTRSGLGARFAMAAAAQVLPSEASDAETVARLKARYDRLVQLHLNRHPLTEREQALLDADALPPEAAYGTTFAAVVLKPEETLRYVLGDSNVLLLDADGHFPPELPADPACMGSATTSLCEPMERVLAHFRCQHTGPTAAALVYSDGAECSVPWRAAELLFAEGNWEENVDRLLKEADHGDDMTLVLACADAVQTEGFRQGLAQECAQGRLELHLEALRQRKCKQTCYLKLLLKKCEALELDTPAQAESFKAEKLAPAANDFAALMEEIKKTERALWETASQPGQEVAGHGLEEASVL